MRASTSSEIKKALETDWERGSLMRGASTITQQLAKNLYLSPTRNPLRKLSRAAHYAPARARAEQDAHLRALSQQHRVGRRHLGRRGGCAHVFRRSCVRGRARSGRADGGRDRQSARAEHRQAECAAARRGSESSARAWGTSRRRRSSRDPRRPKRPSTSAPDGAQRPSSRPTTSRSKQPTPDAPRRSHPTRARARRAGCHLRPAPSHAGTRP